MLTVQELVVKALIRGDVNLETLYANMFITGNLIIAVYFELINEELRNII